VNQLVDGMAQLHRAAQDGNIPALKVLLEFNPNLNVEVRLLSTWLNIPSRNWLHTKKLVF